MNRLHLTPQILFLSLALVAHSLAQSTPTNKTPQELLGATLARAIALIEPAPGSPPRTFATTLKIVRADGLGRDWVGRTADFSFQAPDKLILSTEIDRRQIHLGRHGQHLWIYAPDKKFGVLGAAGVPRFATAPDRKDQTTLPPLKLPIPREQLLLLPLLLELHTEPAETIEGVPCHVLRGIVQPQAAEAFKVPRGELKIWIRQTDDLPVRLGVSDGNNFNVVLDLQHPAITDPAPDSHWDPPAQPDAKIGTVALSHLTRFLPAVWAVLNEKIPSLPPATGERKLIAREGKGRLEDHDGTRVLFLAGTPEEMGHQHGILLRKQVRDLVDKVLYGVGVGSSFEKGRWFFGEIEEAQNRLARFIDSRYLREMDAMAAAAGLDAEELRLANFFPELFHCSGFALFGRATADGRLYHGRILDYLRGVGLERNAVVIVHQPEQGHPWVNISYGGFVGTVTAMNAKHISIGEMGGRGEGHWDGKPMAQLLREVMENAATLDEAIAILRRGPRTCEYYYVVADGNSRRAVGIAATPDTFELVQPGDAHPRLPHAIPDAVVLSAGDRYEKLAERVKAGHGKIDADAARHLMDRPVAMNSNIHSVLFAPETLDFWVANADSKNVASHTRYTQYNLGDLLNSPPPLAK
jgi:hypothetical protein